MINNENLKEDPPSPKDEDINKDKKEISHEEDKQEISNQLDRDWKVAKDHLLDQIQGDIKRGVSTRSHVNNFNNYFVSSLKLNAN